MPGKKMAYRLYSNDGHALIDLLQRPDENPPEVNKRVLCRHPFQVSLLFKIFNTFLYTDFYVGVKKGLGHPLQSGVVVQLLLVRRVRARRLSIIGRDSAKRSRLIEDPTSRPQKVPQSHAIQGTNQRCARADITFAYHTRPQSTLFIKGQQSLILYN